MTDTPATTLEQRSALPLHERMNITGDLKTFIAEAMKELVKTNLRYALQRKGFKHIVVDAADTLKVFITVGEAPHERTFEIKVREFHGGSPR